MQGPNYTERLLSVGAERVGKCRNELPFGENDFRRSAGVETGEPKRFDTFHYTPYQWSQSGYLCQIRYESAETASWNSEGFSIDKHSEARCSLSIIWFILLNAQIYKIFLILDNFLLKHDLVSVFRFSYAISKRFSHWCWRLLVHSPCLLVQRSRIRLTLRLSLT